MSLRDQLETAPSGSGVAAPRSGQRRHSNSHGLRCPPWIAPAKGNICAIIVTFHPDGNLPERVERIAAQVQRVVLIDNHSDDRAVAMLRQLSSRLGVQLILNEENLGVATALNQGMAEVIREGFPWALLFDQDTVAFESMAATLIKVHADYPDKGKLAILGSNYLDPSMRQSPVTLRDDGRNSWADLKVVITSGSLISARIFEAVGPFRDEYFIDDVDHEYCLRVRAHGFKVIMARDPIMVHAVGAVETRRLLWRKVRPSNHSPARWYYMTRNPIVLATEYWLTDGTWVVGNLYRRVKWMIKAILYETDKQAKVRLMLRGGLHGLLRRMGRL